MGSDEEDGEPMGPSDSTGSQVHFENWILNVQNIMLDATAESAYLFEVSTVQGKEYKILIPVDT